MALFQAIPGHTMNMGRNPKTGLLYLKCSCKKFYIEANTDDELAAEYKAHTYDTFHNVF